MAGNGNQKIRGITIELDGDASGLMKSLQEVNKSLKNTQSQLRDVNKALKLDPGNTELLAQKQHYLTEAIDETKEKLRQEETIMRQLKEQAASGVDNVDQQNALQREIIETTNALKDLEEQAKQSASVLGTQMQQAGEKIKGVGDKISSVGTGMTKTVTAPIVASATVAVAAFNEVDSAMDTVIKKTGATGDTMAEMEEIVKDISTEVPTDFDTVGNAVGEVNTRFSVTGESLKSLSLSFIKFADLNDTDVSSSIDNVQKVAAAYNITAEETPALLDTMNAAGQATGISMDNLSQLMVSNAASMKQMGFTASDAAKFLGQCEMSGTDTSAVMTGLSKALKTATSKGVPLKQALSDLQNQMINASSDTEGLSIAYDYFGAKAAPKIYEACKNGTLSFAELGTSLQDNLGSVDDTFDNTLDGIDNMTTATNAMKIAGAELGESISNVVAPILKDVAQVVREFSKWFGALPDGAKETIVRIAALIALIGPALVIIGKITTGIGSIVSIGGKLVTFLSGSLVPAMGAVTASGGWIIGAIALAIAAIAALAYVIYKNWDDIAPWLEDKWNSLKEAWEITWENISTFWSDTWDTIKEKSSSTWGSISEGASIFWDNFLTFWTNCGIGIYNSTVTAWTNTKAWLSNTWSSMVTFGASSFLTLRSNISNTWNAIRSHTSATWNNVKSTISNAMSNAYSTVSSRASSMYSAASTQFSNIVSSAASAAVGVYNHIYSGFENAWSYITGLPAKAFQWGNDLIDGFVGGIKSFFHKVRDTMSDAADIIKQYIHFSRPDIGPLRDYEKWMPDMMQGLADGIRQNQYLVANAMQGLASTMTIAAPNIQNSAQSVSVDMSGVSTAIRSALTTMQSGADTGSIIIPVYLDGSKIYQAVVTQEQRMKYRSGGR